MDGISVITPCASAKYLEAIYENLLNQIDPPAWEWIIFAENSAYDEAIEMDRYPEVKVIASGKHPDHNVGAAIGRNRALMNARMKYIQPLDADDLLADDSLKIMYTALEENPTAGFAFGRASDIIDGEIMAPLKMDMAEGLHDDLSHDEIDTILPMNICWRKELLYYLGGWPAFWNREDSALTHSAGEVSRSYFTGRVTMYYCKREDSLSEKGRQAENVEELESEYLVYKESRVEALGKKDWAWFR